MPARKGVHAHLRRLFSALVKLPTTRSPPLHGCGGVVSTSLPDDAGPLRAALQSSHLDLRVRAAELLAVRHDEHLADPMRALLADKDLARRSAPPRERRSGKARRGSRSRRSARRLVRCHRAPEGRRRLVRRHAARHSRRRRGAATRPPPRRARPRGRGVRSWGGRQALSARRRARSRCSQATSARPPADPGQAIRRSRRSGPRYGGCSLGLEDATRDVQEMVFAILLARDLRAFRRGRRGALTSALSSQRPDVRFAAARGARAADRPGVPHCVRGRGALAQQKPEGRHREGRRERRVRAAGGPPAEALADDRPEQPYPRRRCST